MAIPDQASLQTIGIELAKAAPDGWTRAVLRVSAVAATMDTRLTFDLEDGSVDSGRTIGVEAQMVCDDLRDAMYEDGAGTWYNATFVLTADGGIEADFDYTNPPFDGGGTPDLLEDDQRAYPRDAEHLPDWHPAKRAAER